MIEVFGYTFERMERILKDISGLLLTYYFEKWGHPVQSPQILRNKSIDMSYFGIRKS